MIKSDAWPLLRCETHDRTFEIVTASSGDPARLTCANGCNVPIRTHVPRFVASEHYAGSFGLEWLQFHDTQLDSVTGTTISRDRLERCLGFPLRQLEGKLVLEIGCGSGRFTEVLLAHGAIVCSLDLSEAVGAAYGNIGDHPRSQIVQADAIRAPFAKNAFDIVLCLGVLQHTRTPETTLRAISSHAKPGGLIVVDNYAWTIRRVLAIRYPLRFGLKYLPHALAHRVCRRLVDVFLPIHRAIGRRIWLHAVFSRISPITSYYHVYPQLSDEQQQEFARLDTIDFYTPKYERLQTVAGMQRLIKKAGLELLSAMPGGNGIEVRGRRPL